jgi:hypothetical protein
VVPGEECGKCTDGPDVGGEVRDENTRLGHLEASTRAEFSTLSDGEGWVRVRGDAPREGLGPGGFEPPTDRL